MTGCISITQELLTVWENLSSNTYQYATDVQEVRRYLKGVTGEDISLENLYLTPDGKIGGLPEKSC